MKIIPLLTRFCPNCGCVWGYHEHTTRSFGDGCPNMSHDHPYGFCDGAPRLRSVRDWIALSNREL